MTPQTWGFFLSTALSDRLSTHFIDNSPHEEHLTRVRGTISPIIACSTAQLEKKIEKHDSEITLIFDAIRKLMTPPAKSRRKIGFEGKGG